MPEWDSNLGRGLGEAYHLFSNSVTCQLSDIFLRHVPRRTIIAKTSNLVAIGYRQDYKYRKLHAEPKTLTVVLSLVQTRKNQLSENLK